MKKLCRTYVAHMCDIWEMELEMKIEIENRNEKGVQGKKCICDSGFWCDFACRYENRNDKTGGKNSGTMGREARQVRELRECAGRIQQGRWGNKMQEK